MDWFAPGPYVLRLLLDLLSGRHGVFGRYVGLHGVTGVDTASSPSSPDRWEGPPSRVSVVPGTLALGLDFSGVSRGGAGPELRIPSCDSECFPGRGQDRTYWGMTGVVRPDPWRR